MRVTKIERLKLEQDVIALRKSGMSMQKIADELNESGKLPEGEFIDRETVRRYLDKVPEIQRQIARESKSRAIRAVNIELDVIHEIGTLFNRTKVLMESLEHDAAKKERMIDPYRFKAVSSEMREMLKLMTDIQKEINNYENIRTFMEIVLQTLKEECPDKIPIIAEKLKMSKGTHWFGDLIK